MIRLSNLYSPISYILYDFYLFSPAPEATTGVANRQ